MAHNINNVYVRVCARGARAWGACVVCVRCVRAWCACVMCMRGVRAWCARVRVCACVCV